MFCLEAGILTQRHFPELVSWYLRNSMVAHEIRLRQVLFAQAIASPTAVTLPATFGALSTVFAAVVLQAAYTDPHAGLAAVVRQAPATRPEA
ncbi:major capsid protein [Streptomyces sp. NPDC005262]|uniref:major capsid protein n=1 Tax=Streptomyces sp. NPDC005262 TaxID=3364710 RepID=UPI003695BE5F